MYRVVIIEDETVAAENLARMLGTISSSYEVVARIESVREAVKSLPAVAFDLVFLDIHLTDGSAFGILEKIELSKPIIFTTAYDQYVLQAFKYLSIDYLLKPIGQQELAASIAKYERHFSTPAQPSIDMVALQRLLTRGDDSKKQFLVQIGKKLKPISTTQILFFHSANKSTFLNTEEDKAYPVDFSLSQLEKELDPNQFFRVNRQYIIARSAIQHILMVSPTKMKVVLHAKPDLEIFTSIDRMGRFKNWMR